MPSAPLGSRLADHIRRAGLFPEPGRAVLAVSGGPDSMALLDLMAAAADGAGLSLVVAHADHGLHEGSGVVASRVVETARTRYGLETACGTLPLGAGAGETRAREARYAFLRAVQAKQAARYLVTAHHADDQAETVLLRLMRGSAPVGLAGIPARGPAGLVRPLLPFRRAELAAHAAAAGLTVFHDPANADPRHTRSWVRAQLLPLLEARLGEDAVLALLDVARHAAHEAAAWDAVLEALPGLETRTREGRADVARGVLAGYDDALAARVLRAACRRAGLRLGPRAAARAAGLARKAASGRRLELGEGVVAENEFERLVIRGVGPSGSRGVEEATAAERLEGTSGDRAFNGMRLRWKAERAPEQIERGGWTTWIAPGALVVRVPERGERMVPLGGTGHRELRRLLMESRVARAARGGYPVIVWHGEAVWLPGICRGSAGVPAPGTTALRFDAAAE